MRQNLHRCLPSHPLLKVWRMVSMKLHLHLPPFEKKRNQGGRRGKARYEHGRCHPEAGGKWHISNTGRGKRAWHGGFVGMASLSQQFQSVVWPALNTTWVNPKSAAGILPAASHFLDRFSHYFKQKHQWLELCLARVWCWHNSTQISI